MSPTLPMLTASALTWHTPPQLASAPPRDCSVLLLEAAAITHSLDTATLMRPTLSTWVPWHQHPLGRLDICIAARVRQTALCRIPRDTGQCTTCCAAGAHSTHTLPGQTLPQPQRKTSPTSSQYSRPAKAMLPWYKPTAFPDGV